MQRRSMTRNSPGPSQGKHSSPHPPSASRSSSAVQRPEHAVEVSPGWEEAEYSSGHLSAAAFPSLCTFSIE